jgi:hypothetical protein
VGAFAPEAVMVIVYVVGEAAALDDVEEAGDAL